MYGTTQTGGPLGGGVVFRIKAAGSQPQLLVDGPGNNAAARSFTVGGWAIDRGATSGTGIDTVRVYATALGPGASGAQQLVGDAAYGNARPDIGALFGSRFTQSGYSLGVSGLSAGSYVLSVYSRSTLAGDFVLKRAIPVTVTPPAPTNPVMALDGPSSNSTLGQSVTIAGWAADRSADFGTGVDAVAVYAYPTHPERRNSLDWPRWGLPRPDVGNLLGSEFTNAGFRLTVSMSPGTYTIVAFARSMVAITHATSRPSQAT